MKQLFFILLFLSTKTLVAQKIDANWGKAWTQLHNTIYQSFNERKDTTFIEQVCYLAIELKENKVKKIDIISQNDSAINKWVLAFVEPIKGKIFKNFGSYKYLLVPLKTKKNDSIDDDSIKGFRFFDSFMRAFKNTASKNVIICRGVHLEPPSSWIR